MKCSKIKLVSPYMDGELGAEKVKRFEAHIAGCPECGRRLEGFRALRDGFSRAEKRQAPYGFPTRVTARAKAENRRKLPWLFPVITRFAEAAVVLVMITVGIAAGKFLMGGLLGQKTGNIASAFSLDVFDPAPPDSLGGVYIAMTEAHHEK